MDTLKVSKSNVEYIKASSISKELIYGIQSCIHKVYKRPVQLYYTINNPKYIIENRIVNQNNTYTLTFKENEEIQDKAFYDNDYIRVPFKEKTLIDFNDYVYNIEVENDNSYCAYNLIVHNCQDISNQGNQKGLYDGKSSSLLWQVGRILNEMNKLPDILLIENVSAILNDKHKEGLNEWKNFLKSKGYYNYIFKLKASDFNIPQNRERCFMISLLTKLTDIIYNIEKDKKMTKLTIKDILENVEDKYILKSLNKYLPNNINFSKTNNNIESVLLENYTSFTSEAKLYSINSVSPTLTATGANSRIKILYNNDIRMLNPLECWKLMGFTKNQFDKVKNLHSSNELIKQAGNSIVVNVLEQIFSKLYQNT